MVIVLICAFAATSPSYIEAIGVIFDTHYMDKVFNSCKEVQNPSSNGIAMDILCGQSVSSCTPQAWLDFMATQAPLTINYTIATGTVYNASGSTFDPLDTKAYSCAEAPDLASSACSCSDCTPQCPVPVPPPPPASPCVILGRFAARHLSGVQEMFRMPLSPLSSV